MSSEIPASARPPLALLVPVGGDANKPPQPVHQPVMVLRSAGQPFAVLLVSPCHAYIKAIAASDLKINDHSCAEHELKTGDRIGLGPVTYEFQSDLSRGINGHARPEAFLAGENPAQRFALRQPIVMLGSSEGSDVQLKGPTKADLAVIVELQEGHALVSLDSPPAFQVNGTTRLRHRLAEGDTISTGESSLKYETSNLNAPSDVLPTGPAPALEHPAISEEIAPPEPAPSAAPKAEAPSKRPFRESQHPPISVKNLAAWGPLAHAVISAQTLDVIDLPEETPAGKPRRSRRIWIWAMLILLLLAAGGAFAWWKLHRFF